VTRASDAELAQDLKRDYDAVTAEIGKRIIGQRPVIEQMLITLLAGGNSLLMGVPGLAKTLLVQTLAETVDLSFSRIQFTPDLMPSDITGTELVQEDPDSGRRTMAFLPGPVFANIVLADEINRTPPKTQAALLEAMQERRVTVQGKTHILPAPFFVFATQNPIELEGTYPLPEAQLDRFMFEIVLDYLPAEEELAVVQATTGAQSAELQAIIAREQLIEYQRLTRRVVVADAVARYAVHLVRATRPGTPEAAPAAQRWLTYGASLRAAQFLLLAAKARALIRGAVHVGFEDIRSLAPPVLRHRLLRNFQAESEQIAVDTLVEELLAGVTPDRRTGTG
jgi:MoxR-like ATPase